jgi:hypothetical protein
VTKTNKKSLAIRDKTIFDGIFVKYFLKSIFSLWFKLAGWKLAKATPEGAGVAIAAPHTSNWDFVYALGAAILLDIKIYFSIKDTWCRLPVIGRFMMWLGAMPIDRSSKGQGQVEQIKSFVERQKNCRVFFLFTPEGTRGDSAKWRTGFYHVAKDCGIPIFLAKVDYRVKETGAFHTYQLTDNKEEDIQAIQESYKSVYGKFPKKQFPPYTGPIPKISEAEAKVLRAIYSFKGVATLMEISTKTKLNDLSARMFDYLIEKGVLEQVKGSSADEPSYHLTFAGRGCLLHLYPSLAIS